MWTDIQWYEDYRGARVVPHTHTHTHIALVYRNIVVVHSQSEVPERMSTTVTA